MIVDCHTHMNRAYGDVSTSEHLSVSDTVDVSIVLGTAKEGSIEGSNKLAEYISKYPGRMIGFAFIDPTRDNISVKGVKTLTEKLGLKGAALYCSNCGFHPAHSLAMQFYESAVELGLPIYFHNSRVLQADAVLDYAQPYLVDEVARTFPKLKIVIGNMGVPFIEQTLSMLAKHENVYGDLTIKPGNIWQVYNTVVCAYERGVMDKLLFGSGFPFGVASECIEALLGFNKLLADMNLPPVPRGNIQSIIERDTLACLGIQK
jgi:uncharacterized protein